MKFNVSCKALYSTLSGVSKVINAKNTLTILDNFLWTLEGNLLTVTASDTENTLTARLEVEDAEGEGSFCINAKRICDIAKELPDMNATFAIDEERYTVKISFPGGNFDLMAIDGAQYPKTIEESEEATSTITCNGKQIAAGIDNTLFAVGTDELRPQMMGIFWDIKPEGITFVATDTRKLVKYADNTSAPGIEAHFILPYKPSLILKNLVKGGDTVNITISPRSAVFSTPTITLNSRFIKGNFPDYNRVIPQSNPYVVTVDRGTLLTAVRRASVCADPSHGLIKFRFTPQQVELKVDDPNVSTFAQEEVACDFTGTSLIIGFAASYLIEILSTLPTQDILIKLADPSRPGLFLPSEDAENTSLAMILMPMTVRDF